jgi:cob(I)alamin adenosyltransferase
MEQWMDEASSTLAELRSFILPGGAPGGAALHVARTVCRRAERRVVALTADEPVEPLIVTHLNRLSDFLFVAARRENAAAGVADQLWTP